MLNEKQDIINRALEKIISDDGAPQDIKLAMNYSLLAGGKRIRPVLALTICQGLGGKIEEVLPYACAVECIHTYSLIHDDLPAMDNDDLRRGKPTSHKVFGEALAILAGDGLLNYAFETMLKDASAKGERKFIEASYVLAKASGIGGMIGGQVIDIESEGKCIDADTLYHMHKLKTGALIQAPCIIGCIIAGADEYREAAGLYGSKLGLAFQIKDDILDYSGDASKLGKATGMDSAHHKPTFVNTFGIEKAEGLAEQYTQEALDLTDKLDKSGFLGELTEYLIKREN
jgi:geranylgeranyl diphosphate synthase type II